MSLTLTSTVRQMDDDALAISEWFCEQGYSDGLPVVPPTRERVERMLGGTARDPADVLGDVPPQNGPATVEKLAINAVMAGCRPEYLPVILTAFELMLVPSFDLAGIQPTTNPLTPMLIVNGPIRRRIGLHGGTGCMGPGWQANATIGRAIRLALLNVGGARPGQVDQCTQGFVGKYTLCIAENEEESPWESFSVDRGFAEGEDVLTVVGVNSSQNIHDSSGDWKDVIHTFLGSLPSIGTANVVDPFSTPVFALNPLHAKILSDAGYSRQSLRELLISQATLPANALSARRSHLRHEEGEEHYLVDGSIPLTNESRNLLLPVAGGMQGGHSCFLSNGHYGHATSRVITP
jgi:hypothetical protein